MRFTEYDDVVQALPSDRADESFNISILPGRSVRDWAVPNAHGAETPHKDCPVRGVPIPDEVSRRVVPRERLCDLARNPLRGRICRHAKRYPKATSVTQNDQTIEDLERDRRLDKEVDRRNAVDMVPEKRPPALRGWSPTAA